jgi:hypothetical protein
MVVATDAIRDLGELFARFGEGDGLHVLGS